MENSIFEFLAAHLGPHIYLVALWGGLTGMCVGSFVGVLVDRLPYNSGWRDTSSPTPITGRSRCNSCYHVLDVVSLVPILGWLVRGGRCAFCGERIPIFYPIMETVFFVLSYFICLELGATFESILFLVGVWIALALAWMDVCEGWLPERMTIPLIALGVAFSPYEEINTRAAGAAIGAGGALLCFLWMNWRYRQNMLAGGDVLLCAACGGWFGIHGVSLALFSAGTVGSLVHIAARTLGYRWRPRDKLMAEQLPPQGFLPLGPSILFVFILGLLETAFLA